MLLLIICVCSFVFANGEDVFGYYWRDFDGTIPPDAFPAGIDINNQPIFIGQVYDKYLIPAKIYVTGLKAYYEYGGKELQTEKNIKILCTKHPEQFKWIPTNNDDIKRITDYLVIGGFEPGCTTYIGRVRVGGEVTIGKALADNRPIWAGLHVTYNGKGERHTTFDVLSFTPSN